MSKQITEEQLDEMTEECYKSASCPREYIKELTKRLNVFFTCDCGGACKGKRENKAIRIGFVQQKTDTSASPTGFLAPDSCKS